MQTIGALSIQEFKELIDQSINDAIRNHFTKQKIDIQPKLIDIKEASEYLRMPVQTIYNKVNQNEIPYYKPGKKLLFRISELDSWLEECKSQNYSVEEVADNILSAIKNHN